MRYITLYAKLVMASGEQNEHLNIIVRRLLKMGRLAKAKDNPDNFSDWVKGYVEPKVRSPPFPLGLIEYSHPIGYEVFLLGDIFFRA